MVRCRPPFRVANSSAWPLPGALVNDPELILADEPTGNLDPEMAEETMRLFARIQRQGTTVLIATHDLRLLQRFEGRVLMMRRGRLIGVRHTAEAAAAP